LKSFSFFRIVLFKNLVVENNKLLKNYIISLDSSAFSSGVNVLALDFGNLVLVANISTSRLDIGNEFVVSRIRIRVRIVEPIGPASHTPRGCLLSWRFGG
jgi:hypothetical protein